MSFIGVGNRTINTQANITYTPDIVGLSIFNRDPNGASRTDTLPTATQLFNFITTLGTNVLNTIYQTYLYNVSTLYTITLQGGTNVTLQGATVINPNETVLLLFTVTNITTPTVTCLVVRSNTYTGFWQISDVKSSGTNGGSSSATTWQKRTLNTITGTDTVTVTVNSSNNTFTLFPGTYIISAAAPAYNCGHHKTRLTNNTTGNTDATGSAMYTASSNNISVIETVITLTQTTNYQIDHYTETSQATNGLGVATNVSGFNEIFTIVKILKIQ